jgi:hypothetical protein
MAGLVCIRRSKCTFLYPFRGGYCWKWKLCCHRCCNAVSSSTFKTNTASLSSSGLRGGQSLNGSYPRSHIGGDVHHRRSAEVRSRIMARSNSAFIDERTTAWPGSSPSSGPSYCSRCCRTHLRSCYCRVASTAAYASPASTSRPSGRSSGSGMRLSIDELMRLAPRAVGNGRPKSEPPSRAVL